MSEEKIWKWFVIGCVFVVILFFAALNRHGDPGRSKIIDHGRRAARAGAEANANPYSDWQGALWLDGWIEAKEGSAEK